MKYGFIGCGNMGGAIASALATGNVDFVVSDRSGKAKDSGFPYCTPREVAQQADRIFLAVKPQMMAEVLAELAPILARRRPILISMAAGLTLDRLKELYAGVGYDIPILRIMPNTCVAIGRGVIGLCGEGEAHLRAVERILSEAGCVERLPESLMDQFTSVAGCGPAFVYPFIEALADGGVMTGLPREQALRYAAQTVLGAAAMVLETGEHPGALKDAVCSPGGSTIAGVAALEQEGLRSSAIEAVLASFRRNRELGKN